MSHRPRRPPSRCTRWPDRASRRPCHAARPERAHHSRLMLRLPAPPQRGRRRKASRPTTPSPSSADLTTFGLTANQDRHGVPNRAARQGPPHLVVLKKSRRTLGGKTHGTPSPSKTSRQCRDVRLGRRKTARPSPTCPACVHALSGRAGLVT